MKVAQTQTERLKGRLSGVRKRKRVRKGFANEVLEVKMKLVRTRKRKR